MLYLIIEDYHDGDPVPAYRRFRDTGRQLPDGVRHIGNWVTRDLARCYQVIECDDRGLLDQWMSRWVDLMRFEVIPVGTSAEAAAIVADRL